MSVEQAGGFTIRRRGIIAEPEPGNPHETRGILNPGAARGRAGQLYLFPRVVAEGNYSRIALARVPFDAGGAPPVLTHHGWLVIYHGVSGRLVEGACFQTELRYAAGVLIMDKTHAGSVSTVLQRRC